MQQDQLVRSALRVANTIDNDCITVILAGASGSVSATGKALATTGTEFVISGSGGPGLGYYDIVKAKSQIEVNNYIPDTMLVNPLAKVHLEKLPHFTALLNYGEPRMMEGFIQVPGAFGTILGLECFSSANCPTGSAIVLSRGRTTNILGQYSPLGFFVENFEQPLKPTQETSDDCNFSETLEISEL